MPRIGTSDANRDMMAGDSDSARRQATATRPNGTSSNGFRPRPPGPNDVQPSSGKGEPPKQSRMRPRPWWVSFVLILVLNYLLVQMFLPEQTNQRIDVPYTTFKEQVA